MRDLIITLLIMGSLPFIVVRPYLGILMWSWLSYMNPHRFTWGFAYDMPFAQLVAITTLMGLIFHQGKKTIPFNPLTVAWFSFIVWMLISTAMAMFPEYAQPMLVKVLKIQMVTILTIMLIRTEKQLNYLIWVIVFSIGFFGTKGGVFTILTGGELTVWGPPDSFIEDNNQLAVALLMILPLMRYLQLTTSSKYLKWMLLACMISCSFAIVGSQSRGALLGMMAVAGFFWLKSNHKLLTSIFAIVMLPVLFSFMPDSWHDRMNTIKDYQQDASAMGRIVAWQYSVNVASARLTGGGFEAWGDESFAQYGPPKPNDLQPGMEKAYQGRAAHSIYFSVLGDHGWIGLSLFLLVFVTAWLSAGRIIRQTRAIPDLQWMNNLARMIQVSLVAYASGGLFLSMAYFDLPWHLISILLIMRMLLNASLPVGNTSSPAFNGLNSPVLQQNLKPKAHR